MNGALHLKFIFILDTQPLQSHRPPGSTPLSLMLRRHGVQNLVSSARLLSSTSIANNVGPAAKDAQEIESMLAKPSWSVRSLFKPENDAIVGKSVTRQQLHHLLRLSALPPPESEAEESAMLQDLESQLSFVQAIQKVNTEGVQPLVSIRDETQAGQMEEEINLVSLKEELAKEEVVGTRGRIRRKADVKVERDDAENWDALACAPKVKGRFIALETRKA